VGHLCLEQEFGFLVMLLYPPRHHLSVCVKERAKGGGGEGKGREPEREKEPGEMESLCMYMCVGLCMHVCVCVCVWAGGRRNGEFVNVCICGRVCV
jgi:hypothetical protein